MPAGPAAPSATGSAADARPLCIDLDGTLVRSDLLYESALKALKLRFGRFLLALPALAQGKASLKRRLAELVDLRVDLLPYNPAVLDLARAARESGRAVVLVTASDGKHAQAVADHLGLFDAVYASDGRTNLGAEAKGRRLVELYGEGGFDYLANARPDFAVWRHANRALVADPEPGVLDGLRRQGSDSQVVSRLPPLLHPLLRALRPHQWLKNLLVFLPLFTAHLYGDLGALAACVGAFAAFCLMASAGYLVNDLLDLEADREHPRKRRRPLASGELPLALALALVPLLVLLALLVGAFLPAAFSVALVLYLATTLAYSLFLKRRSTLDVLTLAGLYTLRVIGGAAAMGIVVSFWLLAFSMFFFLSLAYVKRYAELHVNKVGGRLWVVGRGYCADDLPLVRVLGVGAGYSAVLVLALYINSPEVRELYAQPEWLWLVCPGLLYWMARAWTISHRGAMHDDPLVFALEDRVSQLTIVACALAVGMAI